MAEQSHLAKFTEFVLSDDNSELGIARAERDYALHCLEREIAICAEIKRRLDFMEAKYGKIDWDASPAVSNARESNG